MRPVVVIGAGEAGMQFVAHLVEQVRGARVILVDASEDWPYHKPAMSKAYLKDRHEKPQWIRSLHWFERHGVEFIRGARLVAFNVKWQTAHLDNGRLLQYSRLILAFGTHVRVPEIRGLDLPGVSTLRTRQDADEIRRWANPSTYPVVLGAGFLGMEAATAMARHGRQVSIIEAGPRLLGHRVAPEVSATCQRRLERADVTVHLNTTVTEVLGDDRIRQLKLDNGKVIPAEALVVAVGSQLDTRVAEVAKLACDDGILVDGSMRTSGHHVYAIGDCARFYSPRYGKRLRLESIQNASDTARRAVEAMRGFYSSEYDATPWFWSEVAGIRLQICGLSESANRRLVVGDTDRDRYSVYHFAGDELVAVDSVDDEAAHLMVRRFFDLGRLPSQDDIEAGPKHLQLLYNDWVRELTDTI